MISIELWRARIGAFNNKRSRSRCSLSSTYFSIYVFFHWTRHRCRNEELSQLKPHTCPLASPIPLSLPAEERSPAIETVAPESSASSGDLGGDSLSSSSPSLSSSSMSLSSSFGELCFLQRSLLRDAFIILVIAIISQLLIMAGDVETNPGPKHRADEIPNKCDLQCMTYISNGRDYRLLHRVKQHWFNLARALHFPPIEIDIMEEFCDDDISRVYYLLTEWLREANQKNDSRPVTWATLITALKDADIQEEAEILEEQFVEMPHVTRQSSLSPPPSKSAKLMSEDQSSLLSTKFSSSSSSHSSTAATRSQYRVFLKDCYRQPLPHDDKLLTTASKHYIDLAVISRKDITRKEADEFTKKSLHGLTEEILCKKSPIALKDILKPREDGKPVRCVLVEGAPGIGKSTLAWEVCHKWEELDSVKHYDLVVLVQLREKKAQEARCLEDLLLCGATTNMKELVAAIGRGKGVLIVCDGFDELPDEQRQKGSVYIDLLNGRLLPEAAIIVTSRPSVSANLQSLCQHNIDRHLEVIGFTKEYIKRFAESVFSGDILEGFLSYITSNPPIYGMMYIPLNAVIVALIYQDSYDTDTPFPKTMTQLFDALTRALIRRHIVSTNRILRSFRMPRSLQRMEDIKMLPSLVEQFFGLARVAYEGLCEKVLIFTELGEDFEDLGMMKKTTSLNVCTGPECSYTFLHLTLQEYMAALHIALMQPSDLDLDTLKNKDVVVRYLAGLSRHDE